MLTRWILVGARTRLEVVSDETSEAIGALVVDRCVLLAHRSPNKRAYPGVWDLPGGVVEAGESELEALSRELREELGITMAMTSVLLLDRVVAGSAEDPAQISAWLVRSWRGTPENLALDEHVAIGWFDMDQLPPLAHRSVHRALVNAMQGRFPTSTL